MGRGPELRELEAGLDAALEGRGSLFLLSGEPGIGKSRLVDALSDEARARGVTVLFGRAWESGGAPAYFPWLDVLSDLATRLDVSALERALGEGASAASDLVPEIRNRLGAPSSIAGPADESRFRLFRGLSSVARRVSAERGLVIVLEDLHAADESSLLLLQFMARQARAQRLFLVGTYRDVEAELSAEIADALGRLIRDATNLSLSRLSPDEGAELVRKRAGALPPETVLEITARAQGNPLFIEEMARLVGRTGVLPAEVPRGVRDVLRERLSRVSRETLALLEASAVSGDEVEPAYVADGAGISLDVAQAGFSEALRAGVVVPRDGGRFRFSHALVREVLVQGLGPGRRAELHGLLAAALERRSRYDETPPLSELSHHFLEGPSGGLDKAVLYAVRAADRAVAVSAFEDAIALLERVAAATRGADALLRAEVQIALGRAHIRRGAGSTGQAFCLEAARVARSLGDGALLARAALAYGLEITAALVNPTLVGLLEEALGMLPDVESAERARVAARLAAALQPHPELGYPIGIARGALEIARRLGDPGTLLDVLYTGMAAMMDIVHPEERLPLNLEIEQLARATSDSEKLLRTQARLVFDHMELGDLPAADARIDAFERLAVRASADRYLWRVPLFRSMRAMMEGRFSESMERAEQARDLALAIGDPQLDRCYGLHHEGLLRVWERHEDMIRFDPEGRALRIGLYSGPHWQNGGSAFTHSRVEDEEKAAFYLNLVPQDDWPLVSNPSAFYHLGEPLALVGTSGLVAKVYDLLLPASARFVSWGFTCFLWDGAASRVLGLLAGRLGRIDTARAHFEAAIGAHERLGVRPILARTRYEYGRLLVAQSDASFRESGLALLDEARRSARALGMTGLERLAERRLSDRDASRKAPTPRDPERSSAEPRRSDSAPPPARPGATNELPFSFVREGEFWTVTHGAETFRMKDSLGLRYLSRLFAEPDRAIHVLELSGASPSVVPSGDADVVDAGDGGELLDEDARRAYKLRLADLREELREAEAFSDSARAAKAQGEIEFLAAELSRAVGLGGRARRAGSAAERARSAVQRRIRNALARIGEASPGLAGLLQRTVRTGNFCVFSMGYAAKP